MSYLYQQIMNVPGLTGSWQQRNAQYYKALGSPMGAYKGNLQQNLYLLDQIKKKNFPQVKTAAPAPQQPAPAPTPPPTLAQQYTNPLTGQIESAAEIPQFENVMPFYDAWGRMAPQASQAAASMVNPEVMRQYNAQKQGYMNQMASSGGQRFGAGWAGVGSLKADTERQRQAQMQDWLASFQKGYQSLFYDPSKDAWNKARTQAGFDSTQYDMPTWDEYATKYGTAYGTTPSQGSGLPGSSENYYSPLYG